MASAFGHVVVAYAMGKSLNSQFHTSRFWWFTMACCLLPDVDVLGLVLGIPYEHMLGHRGSDAFHCVCHAGGIGGAPVGCPHDPVWDPTVLGVCRVFLSRHPVPWVPGCSDRWWIRHCLFCTIRLDQIFPASETCIRLANWNLGLCLP